MKKFLLLAGILAITTSAQVWASETEPATMPTKAQTPQCTKCPGKMHRPPMAPAKADFEKRLNLTDEQKAQAKEIHKKGFEEIKPIMDSLKLKHEEIEAVKRSKLAPEAQAEKIVQLKKECGELRHKARAVQMKNMKEFEAILTEKQQKELKKIKEEGRKNFAKTHKKGGFRMPPRDGFEPRPQPVTE